jgi:hypothetical protein
MQRSLICGALLLLGCRRNEHEERVALPEVAPDTVVVSWSVISGAADRDSIHVTLGGSRKLDVKNKAPNGTTMSTSRTISEGEYATLVRTLRDLNCCSLQSTSKARPAAGESKPRLELDLGDVQCVIELWDSEWLEGLARECGFAVAQLHGGGFVPDPPVDDAPP